MTEILPIVFSLKEENLYALAESTQIQVASTLNPIQSTAIPRPNQNVVLFLILPDIFLL